MTIEEITTVEPTEIPVTAPEAPAPVSSPDEGEGAPVVVAPPPYQPNLSYKVRGQEKKFDEWVTPVIKDAETEKKVRELYETRDGISFVKQDRENVQRENQQMKQAVQERYQPALETVQQLTHFRDQGNLPAFFKLSGIPLQEVLKFAVNYANLPQDGRSQLENGAMSGIEAYGAQRQHQSSEQMAQQQAAEFKTREFEMLSTYDPQVSRTVADFDGQHGQGAFFEQVRRTGMYHHQSRGVDISVQEAVSEVMKLYGRAPQGNPSAPLSLAPSQAPAQPNMVSTPQAPTPKPVIPGFSGNGTSPVKKVASSFAALKQRARDLEAADD